MKRIRDWKWRNIVAVILFATLLASILFIIINIATAPDEVAEHEHDRSDYTLMLLQCCLGIVVMFLPNILEKRLALTIPSGMYIMYFVFLYCAIYLGEVRSFYYAIPYWDSILHAFSGAMLGAFGFLLVNVLNTADRVPLKTSPFFVAVFAFAFALCIGAVWEIYEYVADGLLGLNMQKFMLQDGTALVGREALGDTMKDLIIDAVSALGVTIVYYVALKRREKRA